MKTFLLGTALAALAIWSGAIAQAAAADSIPKSGQLAFDVMRKGKDIGDYTLAFRGDAKALTVSIATDVRVKVPVIGVSAYAFQQRSTESWQNGRLAGLSSQTNHNGTPHKIRLGSSALVPASLWNADLVASRQVLNTIDGSTDSIAVRRLGSEQVQTGHGPVQAVHYRVSGGLNRDLWYADGQLVHAQFAAEDGSQIDYVLR